MIAAAVALFAACAEKDTFKEVAEENVEIGFGQSLIGKNTRAELTLDWFRTQGTTTTGNAFGVYADKSGTNIFINERVYCKTAQAANPNANPAVTELYEWDHPTIRFWDKGAVDAYNFYAYAPYAAGGSNPAFGNNGFTFTGLPLIAEITTNGTEDKAIAAPLRGKDYADFMNHNAHGVNKPSVDFTFNHILSKLGFKIKTDLDIAQVQFTVKSVKIDFPTATVQWAQDAITGTDGTTTYANYQNRDNSYDFTVFSGSQVVPGVSNGTPQTPYLFTTHYIVTPVNAEEESSSHVFKIEVIYDLHYEDGDVTETNCTATGIIGTGTPAQNVFAPEQNDYNVVIINLHPETIEFCVEGVEGWDTADIDPHVDIK